MPRYRPISPDALTESLADTFTSQHPGVHPLRVAFDAPRCADAGAVAARVCDRLGQTGRPAAFVDATGFYRDASLRYEFGKTDVESFYSGWLDTAALQREVLNALGEHSQYLPALRDPATNRSTRDTAIELGSNAVVIVVGELLLGIGLAFDLTVHFDVSRQARKRQTVEGWQWTLPAFDRYEIDVDPMAVADVVVRYDDPKHPAIR